MCQPLGNIKSDQPPFKLSRASATAQPHCPYTTLLDVITQPRFDPDAEVLVDAYQSLADVWSTSCRRAAASHVAVSDYLHGELVRLARHPTIEDCM
jgi:hypothetical protein